MSTMSVVSVVAGRCGSLRVVYASPVAVGVSTVCGVVLGHPADQILTLTM
jgi:hypothetical protein